jgi:hypothetical protein
MSYIELRHRGDRIGNNIINYIAQINYADKRNYAIMYDINQVKYNDSIFIRFLIDIIDILNKNKICVNECFNPASIYGPGDGDMNDILSTIVKEIGMDIHTYFKTNFLNKYIHIFDKYAEKYINNFDINNTVIIHLRFADIGQNLNDWPDYHGSVCGNYYKNLINNDERCKYTNLMNNHYNKQSPLSPTKINNIVDKIISKYPTDKIIIIVNPEIKKLPIFNFEYELIQNDDYNLDLVLMTKCKKIVLSRSMFSVSSLFFGLHDDIYMPLWGHFVCCGFDTKYDNTKNNNTTFNYFY